MVLTQPEIADNGVSTEDFVDSDAGVAEIKDALMKLPQSYYEILLLTQTRGLSLSELSDVLDITYENAKKRLARARARLKIYSRRCTAVNENLITALDEALTARVIGTIPAMDDHVFFKSFNRKMKKLLRAAEAGKPLTPRKSKPRRRRWSENAASSKKRPRSLRHWLSR